MSAKFSIFILGILLIFPRFCVPVLAATGQVTPETQVLESQTEIPSTTNLSPRDLKEIEDALNFHRKWKTQEEIVNSITKRFTWIGIIVAIVGLFGITAIANLLLAPILNRARDAVSRATAEVELASRTIEQMRSATMEAKGNADTLLREANEQKETVSKIVRELAERAADLDKRFNSVQANAENVRDQLEQTFLSLDERLIGLANEIPQVADEQRALREVSETKLDEFKENSNYEIYFAVYGNTEVPQLSKLMDHLRTLGFRVTGETDPNLSAASPTETNKAALRYTEIGGEKFRQVADEIMAFTNILVEPDARPSESDLAGDLQVGFQRA